MINYQGRLVSGSSLPNGVTNMIFRLYPSPAGPTSLYAETQTVTLVDGLYAVALGKENTTPGALADVFTNAEVYLEVVVGGVALAPRERIVAVGYALQAAGLPQGAITTDMLGPGVVASNNLAPGAVNADALAKRYLAGEMDVNSLPAPTDTFFAAYQIAITNALAPPFHSTPVVSLSLSSESPQVAGAMSMRVRTRTTNAFTASVNVPETYSKLLEANVGTVGQGISLAEVAGKPAAAVLLDDGDNSIEFVRSEDADGTTWRDGVFVTNGLIGTFLSLAEVQGRPAFAFSIGQPGGAPDDGKICFIRANDSEGSSWGTAVTVTANPATVAELSMVNGQPAILAQDTNGTVFLTRANDSTGSSWPLTKYVIATNASIFPGRVMTVVNFLPAVVFRGASNWVYYVRAADPNGTTWNTPLAVVTQVVASACSLAVAYGTPSILYSAASGLWYLDSYDVNGNSWFAEHGYGLASQPGSSVSMTTNAGALFAAATLAISNSPAQIGVSRWTPSLGWDGTVVLNDGGASNAVLSLAIVNGEPALAHLVQSDSSTVQVRYRRNHTLPASQITWIAVEQ